MSFIYMPAGLRGFSSTSDKARWVSFTVGNALENCSLVLDGRPVPEIAVFVGGYSPVYSVDDLQDSRVSHKLVDTCLGGAGRRVVGLWEGMVEVSAALEPTAGESLAEFARAVMVEAEKRQQTDIYVTRPRGGVTLPVDTSMEAVNALAYLLAN